MRVTKKTCWLHTFVAAAVLLSAAPAAAQTLAPQIARADANESLHFSYESRPEVCGDGENIMIRIPGSRDDVMTVQRRRDGFSTSRGRSAYERMLAECRHGPVTIELTRSANRVTRARITVAATEPAAGRSLGTVTAADAVAYLLGDGVRQSNNPAADQLVFAATLANAESWPGLLRVARDRDIADSPRKSAIFWLAQAAGAKAAEGLTSLVGDDSDELDVRKHAVFALSQIKTPETIDALIRIARTNREPQIRKDAMFWLGQSRDPRALAFFEEILNG